MSDTPPDTPIATPAPPRDPALDVARTLKELRVLLDEVDLRLAAVQGQALVLTVVCALTLLTCAVILSRRGPR